MVCSDLGYLSALAIFLDGNVNTVLETKINFKRRTYLFQAFPSNLQLDVGVAFHPTGALQVSGPGISGTHLEILALTWMMVCKG